MFSFQFQVQRFQAQDRLRVMLGLSAVALVVCGGCANSTQSGSAVLPASDTPLEAAWAELIQIHEQQFQKLAGVHNASQAEAASESSIDYHRQRQSALKKIAELGGTRPPDGVPEKYRQQYKDVEDRLYARDHVVAEMLTPERRNQLNEQLTQAVAADPLFANDPFERSPAAKPGAATITLVNNKSLPGSAHQQLISRLQQLAGASSAESVIDPNGTYKVVLAPVNDFARFVSRIPFGDVSHRDDSARTFTLTIDPQKFNVPSAPGAPGQPPFGPSGRPGEPGFGGPPRQPGGGPAAQMQQRKDDFVSKMGGAENCATLVLNGAPDSGTPEYDVLLAKVKADTGATSSMGLSLNGQRQLLIAPVSTDIEELAGKINFGTVTAKDATARELTVAVTPP